MVFMSRDANPIFFARRKSMSMKSCCRNVLGACLLAGLAGSATAAPVYWAEWTSAHRTDPSQVVGTITIPGVGPVGVTYTGDWVVSNLNDTGTNYWLPPSTYADGTMVDNAPSRTDLVGLFEATGTCTVTFSQPVVNPVMAVVGLGRTGVAATTTFDAPFNIVAHGPGYFGNGSFTEEGDTTLQGQNGNGTIQFLAPVSMIQWTIPRGVYWYGFTVGIGGEAGPGPGPGPGPSPASIPAPGALLLASLGTALIGYLRGRRAL
jgi:hypothetical protein